MSPEQARGTPVDRRSDIFSLGVRALRAAGGPAPVRARDGRGDRGGDRRRGAAGAAARAARAPPGLSALLRRCLEKDPEDRFRSAHDLALALEAVQRVPAGTALAELEEQSPYPGLRSFTEKEAAAFLGREQDALVLWQALGERRLHGVIGPSGAGKTSFVRAGVIATRPPGWAAIVCTPGTSPLRGLGRALAPELQHDPAGARAARERRRARDGLRCS